MIKICDIPISVYDLTKNSKPNLWPDPYIKMLFQTYFIISFLVPTNVNALLIGYPKGGGDPRADVGEYGDFVVGEMWGLRFLNAILSGRMWVLCFWSTERRLGTIDCSLHR